MDSKTLKKKAEEYIRLEGHPEFRSEVEALIDQENWDDINDRFYTDLSFGTGGLRGVIGGGFNRMNPFVVRRATQGLASYILRANGGTSGKTELSAVIAYDSRHYSDLFALEAALVLCGNGIITYLFSELRPTPELSFAVRRLNASAGIVVTASHNPPEYNGYKVYWSDGAQVVPPHDTGIIEEVRKVSTHINRMDKKEAEEQGMLRFLDTGMDDDYTGMVMGHVLRPAVLRKHASRLKIVYTPLHGTGALPTERVLKEMGFTVHTVPEQREPDGNFPTVEYPNPEEASAMKLAVDLGRKTGADLVMGTDPDADRLGIAVPDGDDYRLLTGNQLGALLADYIFNSLKAENKMPEQPAFIKTIVTTELQSRIAEKHGALVYNVLTGFKYIGEKIREFEDEGITYLFGGEESYGYLVGSEVRDKDAVSAAAMTAEMALYNLSRGKSVLDYLNDLYMQHGYFEEILISKTLKGEEGIRQIRELMDSLRTSPPSEIGSMKIVKMKDYLEGCTTDVKSGRRELDIGLPSSNVLQFITEEGSVISARPSGTEPKIKFYASCTAPAGGDLETVKREVKAKLEEIGQFIRDITG